jgi:hypothetical protein
MPRASMTVGVGLQTLIDVAALDDLEHAIDWTRETRSAMPAAF